MKKVSTIVLMLVLAVSVTLATMPLSVAPSQLATLTPGVPATITQTLDINVVFVGFQPVWIDTTEFMAWQLPSYEPVVRSRLWYGVEEKLGLHFDFQYNVIFSENEDPAFDNDYFNYIISVGTPTGLTLRQASYNGLSAAERANYMIPEPNYMVEANLAESWLEANAPRLGIDAVNEYTLFFLNSYDFCPTHTYWFIDEPDPDTGLVFGAYGSRVLTGWGGQFGRSWFLDLSAGPDRFLFRTLLPDPSTYGSAVRPIWEFTQLGGYRTDLTVRLAKITRFVGVDMLFTPSPLYPPYIQPPVLPEHIQFDVNMFEHSATYVGADWFTPSVMAAAYADFEPYLTFSVSFQDRRLVDYPVLKKAFENWAAGNWKSIYGRRSPYWLYADAGIDFHLYFSDNLFRFLTEAEGSQADYSVPIFSYAVDDAYMGVQFGLGGYADDNWVDGTQEYIYTFNCPYWAAVGYGYTLTAIHEAGHHICLSHPHDGFDPVYGEVYYQGQFVWVGDHSYTVMNYHDITYHFGVFNKDSMYRYMTIEYLNYANKILKMIMDHPHASNVASMIAYADSQATAALADYDNMDYLGAVTKMKDAYDTIVDAALLLHIPLEPYNWQSTYTARAATLYDPLLDP